MSYTYPQTLDAMQKVASDLLRVAGQKNGISYSVAVIGDASAQTASVNWNRFGFSSCHCTIRFPVKNPGARVSQQEFLNYAGFVFHEVGHPLFTDKTVWEMAVAAKQHRLLNAIEDVRIEKALIDAGIAVNGQQVLTDLVKQLDVTAIKPGFNPNKSSKIGFVMGYLGRAQNGYDMDTALLTSKLLPSSPVSKAIVWALPELAACQSTQDCWDLAKRLLAALPKDKPEETPKGPMEGEGEQEQETQPEQVEADDEGYAEEDEPEAPKGQPQPQADVDGEAEGDEPEAPKAETKDGEKQDGGSPAEMDKGGKGEEAPVEEPLSDDDVEEVDLAPPAGDMVAGSKDAKVAAMVVKAIREASQASGVKLPQAPKEKVRVKDGTELAEKARKHSKHRALLAAALKRNEEDLYEGGLKHGKLDRRAFAALKAGSQNVMGRRSMIDGYETDCVVLVDCSGSMEGRKMEAAAELSLVIAQACGQVGVACSTYGFGTGMATERGPFGLIEAKVGKGQPDARSFASLVRANGGFTPLCGALVAVAVKQRARAASKRRVIFVISDGGDDDGDEQLKGVADYVEDTMGAELANLFIGSQVLGCFRNEVAINPWKDIADAGLRQLTAKLGRGA